MYALRPENNRLQAHENLPEPLPAHGESVVQVHCALWNGRLLPASNFTPGTDFVGLVLPSPAAGLWAGKRVTASPILTCGTCELCRGGASGLCPARIIAGSPPRDGALAQLIALPTRNLVEVPQRLQDHQAVFAWPVACAARSVAAARLSRAHFVTVLGDHPSALLIAQLAARQSDHVRILGRSPWISHHCERLGLRFRSLDDAGRRHDQHVVIDASSTQLANIIPSLLRPRGLAVFPSTLELPDAQSAAINPQHLAAAELTITGCFGGSISEGLALLASGAVSVNGLADAPNPSEDGSFAPGHSWTLFTFGLAAAKKRAG